jgi:hypothetical protein
MANFGFQKSSFGPIAPIDVEWRSDADAVVLEERLPFAIPRHMKKGAPD